MSSHDHSHGPAHEYPPDWNKPAPEHIPEHTAAPFFLALGLLGMFWGLLTSLAVSLTGLGIFLVSLTGWIKEFRHEKPDSSD